MSPPTTKPKNSGEAVAKLHKHLGNWFGSFVKEIFPHLYEQGPVCQALLPQYHLHSAMLEMLEEGAHKE